MLEKHVKDSVKKLLAAHGWFYWMPPANGYGVTGIADINALREGMALFIETKVDYNKVTEMQRRFLLAVRAHGAYAFVVNQHRLYMLEEWLTAITDGRNPPDNLTHALSDLVLDKVPAK